MSTQGAKSAHEHIVQALESLTNDLAELCYGKSGCVARIDAPGSPEQCAAFYRDYVATGTPVVLAGAANHWPAMRKWTNEGLAESMGEAQVTVALTPDGLADAVAEAASPEGDTVEAFCLPHERRMTMRDFLALSRATRDGDEAAALAVCGIRGPVIPYLSKQNSSLSDPDECGRLAGDVDAGCAWFERATGASEPDAVNVWIGDDRSTTSFHKDHYENIYGVVRGGKTFHLLPPTDGYRLGLTRLPVARYTPCSGDEGEPPRLQAVTSSPRREVVWSPVHPPGSRRGGTAGGGALRADDLPPPLVAHVGPGDVLYLPAMWYHYVEQGGSPDGAASGGSDLTVAVNYWYDMRFDRSWALAELTRRLAVAAGVMDGVAGGGPVEGSDAGSQDTGEDSDDVYEAGNYEFVCSSGDEGDVPAPPSRCGG